ncbi:MAG: Uncharacterised protein [Polaribacter sejongensis]|nr:MAG: Uncharacterised protein [Polaribacter sejongensis]
MNKFLLLLALTTLGILNGFSQSKKNDLKLTVSALPLFGSSEDFSSGLNGFVIKPTIGYYISEKTSIELNFSYASMNDLKIGNINSYYNSYSFIPTLRNNFVNTNQLRIFSEFGFGLGTIKYNADNNDYRNLQHEELSGGIAVINIGIGGNYFFNEKFGIEFIIPYITTNNITSQQSNTIYSGIGPTIGLTYKLN